MPAPDDFHSYLDDLTDDVTAIDVVASEDAWRFIAARGGDLYVWVSQHGYGRCGLALLEARTDQPRTRGRYFCRVHASGFDVLLDADRRFWPRTLELEMNRSGRKVRAYWNGLAWVA
jgi:hypothetical protein